MNFLKAIQILSHNAIVIRNERGKRCVVTGKGIGFNKQKGDQINKELIQHIFIEDSTYFTQVSVANN